MSGIAGSGGSLFMLQINEAGVSRTYPVAALPFVLGRAPDSHLVLQQPYVSRRHAEIVRDGAAFLLRDEDSRPGTFVNGERITLQRLRPGDRIQLGSETAPQVWFVAHEGAGASERPEAISTTLGLLQAVQAVRSDGSDLERLRWFLQAAHELNSVGAVDAVLASLLQATLSLAKVERGYVLLANDVEELHLALGLDATGQRLSDAGTVSQTVVRQAIEGRQEFLVTDTFSAEGHQTPESLVAHSIRAVICIPLRERRVKPGSLPHATMARRLLGVLYLDSRFEPTKYTDVDHELMRTIAREAAALVENAQLAAIEEGARLQNEELQIAAGIQQGLMAVQIPTLDFAEVQAHSIACKAVGGDFFDVMLCDNILNIALVDVSGKGISAAILASTLQGMLYVQMKAGQRLEVIASAANDYLCEKNVGKYATMLLLRLHSNGWLEYINCGHIEPRLCARGKLRRLKTGNAPVGLLPNLAYVAGETVLESGARLVLVSDGFTEAEDAEGRFFGEERMEAVCLCGGIEAMLEGMRNFCREYPLTDDCTVMQVAFRGTGPAELRVEH